MRIFLAGIETETNSFSPIPTGIDNFNVTRLDDLKNGTRQLEDIVPFAQWQKKAMDRKDEIFFGVYAWAGPAGLTTQSAYEFLRNEVLSSLQESGPVDVVLLCLHGAMMAHGYDDCEGDLLKHIRQHVGAKVIIAAELDLHCHLTEKMIKNADILITFKEYPHVDVAARGKELFDLAIAASLGLCRPTMDIFDCRMIGMYPTTAPVMRGFIDAMLAVEKRDDVLSVSFSHGFPFGDVPDGGGKVLVVTDNNLPLAQLLAEQLGQQIFALRHRIGFNALPLTEALQNAITSITNNSDCNVKPVVVADQSDNPGGGAPSDSTFALRWLLEHQVESAALAIFYDPQVVKLSIAAGVGADLSVRLGGKMGVTSGDPLDLHVTVNSIKRNYFHQFPQDEGEPVLIPLGDTVALHCAGIDIVVSSNRCQCYCPTIFDDLNIPSTRRQILIVKSSQHFYGAFYPIASEIIYMAGPGAVPPIMKQIPYQRMSTVDKFPWVDSPFGMTSTI